MNTRRSLLSSPARVQAPWIKVTIGTFTFGVFDKKTRTKDVNGFYSTEIVKYPNYIKSLSINKINGKVNEYSLSIAYPVLPDSDPNFFEKVFSSVSKTREIIFSYGDSLQPSLIYKDEKALITNITTTFDLRSSVINYNISAVSTATLGTSGSYNFLSDGAKHKPSSIIKDIFKNANYGLQDLFPGMNIGNLDLLIAGDDKAVKLESKVHISIIDYILYLVSCMIPAGTTSVMDISNDIYILTIHDENSFDELYNDDIHGAFFKVTRTSYKSNQNNAYEIDIGYNSSTIVTDFRINNNENYSILYDYQKELHPEMYVNRINKDGEWEKTYAPAGTSAGKFDTDPDDVTWWTKLTKYPIQATITIQGLMRPALLMTYIRLNIIFPGGHKHIASGLYIITKQRDTIDETGYRTTLTLTRISGDSNLAQN